MEAEGTPNLLSELILDLPPVSESVLKVYRSLGSATIEAEEGRLRERFLDIGGRLAAINEVMES